MELLSRLKQRMFITRGDAIECPMRLNVLLLQNFTHLWLVFFRELLVLLIFDE